MKIDWGRIPKKQLVEVDWVDSWSSARWENKDTVADDDGVLHCRSVGYVLRRGQKSVVLAASMSESGNVGDRICIPRPCVKTIRKVTIA